MEKDIIRCVVPDCQISSETCGISMHQFPENKTIKKAWTAKIFNDSKRTYRNTEAMRVCSAHFRPDDYEIVSGVKILKTDAKPSQKLPEPEIPETSQSFLPKKKIKLEKVHFSDFANLPDLVLNKIFSYLRFEDRWNAAYACRRWYEITRNSPYWTNKVDIKVKSPFHFLKFLLILPSSVTYLNICCDSFSRRNCLWLPDVICRLHERCPRIKTLIIENIFFAQRFCNVSLTTDHISLTFETVKSQSSKQKKNSYTNVSECRKECCSKKTFCDKYIPRNRPQELRVFSIRYARSFMSHLSSQLSLFFPKIKVLDLTYSTSLKTAAIPFFLRLVHLEELYLVGCSITTTGIKSLLTNLKGLKVLDLEGSPDTDDRIFEIIQRHGHSLEKLYLGNTEVESFALDNDQVFPNLQVLCLKNTLISDSDMSYFIMLYPNLKYIDGSFCKYLLMNTIISIEADANEKQFVRHEEGDPTALCHHFKKKYM